MSGTSGDEDSDVSTLFSLACTEYYYQLGGGKPSAPMVPPMQHAGALACTEWETPCHLPVRQGVGKEAQATGGGGSTGEFGEGPPGLHRTI